MDATQRLSGWGLYPASTCYPQWAEGTDTALKDIRRTAIARGQGRSYGDAALNTEGTVVLTDRLSRILALDEERGVLRAEAGATMEQILGAVVPRGWFPTVVPGTRHVSLGGCVAADVHGKNHHRDGTFGARVREIALATAAGPIVRCGPAEQPELFWATVGGMGLTGIIREVAFDLRRIDSAYMHVRHYPARALEEMLALFDDPATSDLYTTAWIDCVASGARFGRGVVMAGHHATRAELPRDIDTPLTLPRRRHLTMPCHLPPWVLNRVSIGIYNALFYRRQAGRGTFVTGYDTFMQPLDVIAHWNRMYGRAGFVQYQPVLPAASGRAGVAEILRRVVATGGASFLAVLKRMGPEGSGLLSFPLEGYTLALDFPVNDRTFALLRELDAIVLAHGGRVYLAKDALLDAETFARMYPRLEAWRRIKYAIDPANRFSSDQSRRLGLTPPT